MSNRHLGFKQVKNNREENTCDQSVAVPLPLGAGDLS